MKKTWITIGGLVAMTISALMWSSVSRADDPGTQSPSLAQRVELLETRMVNLQRLIGGIDLADRRAVEAAVAQQRAEEEQARIEEMFYVALSMRHTLESQIALYKISEGRHPDLLKHGWSQLADYLAATPKNPFNSSSTIVAPDKVTSKAGWAWDARTGTIFAVMPKDVIKAFDAAEEPVIGY